MQPEDTLNKRYVLQRQLGQNRAQTWLAWDLQTQQNVVIKALALPHLQDWKDWDLFEREVKTLQNLNIPGVPRYFSHFEQDQIRYLVMQYLPGQSLADWLAAGKRCEPALLENWARQILATLTHLHTLHPPIVHRDLKPGNLIWDGQRLFLVDFGGVMATLEPSGGATITGTYGYMAPEQFAGKAQPASDLYSLGATLIHLASHKAPAELLSPELSLDFKPHLQLSPDWSDWLEKLVAPRPQERFPSAQAALAALDEWQKVSLATPSPPAAGFQECLALAPAHCRIRVQQSGENLKLSFPQFWESENALIGFALWSVLLMVFVFWSLSNPLIWMVVMLFALPGVLVPISTLGFANTLELTPQQVSLSYRWGLHRALRLAFEPPQLSKLRWENVFLQAANPCAQLQFCVGYKYVSLGNYVSLDELIWAHALILAWFKTHLPPEEYASLEAASPELHKDPRYTFWKTPPRNYG